MAEAQKLGLYDLLMEQCTHEQPFIIFGGTLRDYRTTTPQKLPALTFFHATMQEVVLDAAKRAGAEVHRGAVVRNVRLGQPAYKCNSAGGLYPSDYVRKPVSEPSDSISSF